MKNLSSFQEKILRATDTIQVSTSNIEINTIIEDIIVEITDAEFASVWIHDAQILTRQRVQNSIVNFSESQKEGLLYQCFAKKEAKIYNYISSQKGYISVIDNPDNIKIRSKIMMPILDNEKLLGIATAYSSIKKVKKFTNEDMELFEAIIPFVKSSMHRMRVNEKGVPEEYIVAKSDTTENLKEVDKYYRDDKAPQEILEYVSNIVHDIRTPANGLLGFLDILQEEIKDKRLQEYIIHAKNSALLINDLTTSILDGVSSKKNPKSKEKSIVNTIKYFSEIADVFSANMYKKQITYNIFIDPYLPKEIELNSMKIKRVIMNLIGNASKFTPENGCIEFSVRYKAKEQKLHVYVKDSGIGIAKEKQKEIFEAFKQAEENTKDLYGGTGLGLSICAGYVKEMGGKLSIDSELDKGSVFYFDLPMEIKDYAKKFTPIENNPILITVLMDKQDLCSTNHMARYLVKMGINVDAITPVSHLSQVPNDTTHLITFQNKLSGDVFINVRQKKWKHLVIEEKFLSINVENLDGAMLVSKYSNMGDVLYSFANKNNKPKVLIVEDDKMTISLLSAILDNEYCQIDVAHNGKEGLFLLKESVRNSTPYTIVYTDQNMPLLCGDEMLREYKKFENEDGRFSITTVSISGDSVNFSDKELFDICATKPFNKNEIVSAFLEAKNNKEKDSAR